MVDMALYLAIQDEIHRINAAIHRGLRPTIYREGKTYLISWAFFESDVLWFDTHELVIYSPSLHMRVPFITNDIFHCQSESEWARLLSESNIERNVYFAGFIEVTGKLVSGALTNRTSSSTLEESSC